MDLNKEDELFVLLEALVVRGKDIPLETTRNSIDKILIEFLYNNDEYRMSDSLYNHTVKSYAKLSIPVKDYPSTEIKLQQ